MSDHNHDLDALMSALGKLSPSPPSINRDRLLYQAGQLSARSRLPWAWPAATGAFASLSIALGLMLAVNGRETGSQAVRNPDQATAPAPSAAVEARPLVGPRDLEANLPQKAGYFQLRDQVVRFGAESLPTATVNGAGSPMPIEPWIGLPVESISDWQKTRWQNQHFRGGV